MQEVLSRPGESDKPVNEQEYWVVELIDKTESWQPGFADQELAADCWCATCPWLPTDLRWTLPRLSVPMTKIARNRVWMSDLSFHEKAGRCQQLLSLGKVISDVFLCPDIGSLLVGEAAVKAERSEFIWSLDGRRSQP